MTRLGSVLAEVADRRTDDGFDVEPIVDEPPRRSFVLPEFDNVYFCSKDTAIGLIEAKRRLVHAGAMPGTLITGGTVRATWTAAGGRPPELNPWSPLAGPEEAEFARFRDWWSSR